MDLEPAIQAGGHPGAKSGNGVFVKPTNNTEIEFYQAMLHKHSPILDIAPAYMGTLEPQAEGEKPCVVLEDVLHAFVNPSVLDIKLGSILWDSKADAAKVERMRKVAQTTTTGSLGFRITGMSVVQKNKERKVYDKQYGREQVTAENVGEYLRPFFPVVNEYTIAVKEVLQKHIDHILEIVARAPVEMHSASILLVYEGDMDALKRKVDNQNDPNYQEPAPEPCDDDDDEEQISPNAIVSAKLIDFGHAYFVDAPYEDLVSGLRRFAQEWEKLKLE